MTVLVNLPHRTPAYIYFRELLEIRPVIGQIMQLFEIDDEES
jgi:hypothetical protein